MKLKRIAPLRLAPHRLPLSAAGLRASQTTTHTHVELVLIFRTLSISRILAISQLYRSHVALPRFFNRRRRWTLQSRDSSPPPLHPRRSDHTSLTSMRSVSPLTITTYVTLTKRQRRGTIQTTTHAHVELVLNFGTISISRISAISQMYRSHVALPRFFNRRSRWTLQSRDSSPPPLLVRIAW